ncbi:hypothetical protein ACQPZA_23370 [Pseudonocardia xinjiangensis]
MRDPAAARTLELDVECRLEAMRAVITSGRRCGDIAPPSTAMDVLPH